MAGKVRGGCLLQPGSCGSRSKRLQEQQLDSFRKRKTKKWKSGTTDNGVAGTSTQGRPKSGRPHSESDRDRYRVTRTGGNSTAGDDEQDDVSEDEENGDAEYSSEETIDAEESDTGEDSEDSEADEVDLSEGCLDEFSEGSASEEVQSDPDEQQGGESGPSKEPSSCPLRNPTKVDGRPFTDKMGQKARGRSRPPLSASKVGDDLDVDDEKNSSRNSLLCTQMAWGDLPLSRPLLRAVEAMGYVHPTRIQVACLRPALEGRDLLANAQTGSGKTAAFLLPTLERLLHSPGVRARKMTANGPTGGLRGTKVLVLLPTRELAMQCVQMLQCLSKLTPITHALASASVRPVFARRCLEVAAREPDFGQKACGGMTLKAQEKAIQQQPDIVVATPGRILDLLLNSPSVHLELLEIIVLDEADRLLELGFREEILAVLRHCHRARQTLLFSATLTPSIASLAALALNSPLHISANAAVAETAGCAPKSRQAYATEASLKTVSITLEQQFVMLQKEEHRIPALLHLCTTAYTKNVIVFFQTKQLAHRTSLLFKLMGLNCAELHGNLTQQMRVESLERFHAGEADFLLASELASRGLDIAGVEVVINFNVPQDIDRYIHSVGRTARMGKAGVSVTLYNREGAERLQVKRLLQALQGGQKGRAQGSLKGQGPHQAGACGPERRVLQRRIDTEKLDILEQEVRSFHDRLSRELKREKAEREMRLAELYLKKAENLQAHADEIYSRPMRQWFMTAKEKQILKKNSKSVLGNTEPRGLEESPPRGSRGDEETEASAPSESEGEGKSTPADEEGRHQEDGDEGETDDEQDSDEDLPEWITAASSEDECTSAGEESSPSSLVTVKEFKVAKNKQHQTASKEKVLPPEHKKQRRLTAAQRERMKERQFIKAAARSAKRTHQPKRLRLTHQSPDEVDDDRRRRQKKRRKRSSSCSNPEEHRKLPSEERHGKGGSRATGKKRFKSKGRYKRR